VKSGADGGGKTKEDSIQSVGHLRNIMEIVLVDGSESKRCERNVMNAGLTELSTPHPTLMSIISLISAHSTT
jgi:hypothetical protein